MSGVLATAAGVILVVLALFLPEDPWVHAAIGAGAIAWGVIQIRWLKKLISSYEHRLEKNALTTRRFQNISTYFESILQDSTDIIFSVDTEGYILKFNNGAEQHFGYTQAEIVGKPLKLLFVNEVDEIKITGTVLRDGKSTNCEVPMKTKDGRIMVLSLSMSEMKNDNNHIIGLVVTAKDITQMKQLELELQKKNEQLERLAITDSLTDLYNSRHFFDQIKREMVRYNRNPEHKIALMMVDIDRFKDLNDTQGHQMGDRVLKSLGEVIKVCIRKDIDSGYRYGGDEFIVLLLDTDKNNAKVVADRVQKQFGAFRFGETSLSIGIVEAMVGEDDKMLLKRADEAMYTSKRMGKARITVL